MYFKFFIVFLINFYLFIYSTSANNNLSNYEIVNFAIPLSLTSLEGDPDNGRNIVISREGKCLACHIVPNISDKFQGNIGPSLAGVGNRYTIGELRLRLVDPYVISSTTLMPAFYKNKGLIRVDEKYIGKSILNNISVSAMICV